jgi:hypothetical protein
MLIDASIFASISSLTLTVYGKVQCKEPDLRGIQELEYATRTS